jgi:hypothetical protein
MAIWQSMVKIALTSLFSGLIVVIIAALLNLRFTGKSLREILLSRKKITYLFFVLLILLIPIAFSLPTGTLLSAKVFVVYLRELLISVVIVVSFSVTWIALDDPASIQRLFKVLYTAAKRAITPLPTCDISDAMQPAIPTANPREQSAKMELDNTLLALDRGEIAPSVAKEAQQFHSLEKWRQGNVVGLYELCEMARLAGGLHPTVRSTVKAELSYVQQTYPAGSLSAECAEQLQLSLSNSW